MGSLAALVFSAETTLRQTEVSHATDAIAFLEKDRRVITLVKVSTPFRYIHGMKLTRRMVSQQCEQPQLKRTYLSAIMSNLILVIPA
jgi:hypothetical protein